MMLTTPRKEINNKLIVIENKNKQLKDNLSFAQQCIKEEQTKVAELRDTLICKNRRINYLEEILKNAKIDY
jgi:hypothetical protein